MTTCSLYFPFHVDHFFRLQDKAAAETVCGLSRKWTDLTANAVQATITSLSPPDLEMIADEVESGITILRSCDMKGLSPTMTPDELADMIMAATRI